MFSLLATGALLGSERRLMAAEDFQAISETAWRSTSGALGVAADGFAVRTVRGLAKFRWNPSMQLTHLIPEDSIAGNTYVLSGATPRPGATPRAKRVRAVGAAGVSVVYYGAARGAEFDIEVLPEVDTSSLSLESLDSELSAGPNGEILIDGERLLMRPVAYTVAADGTRHYVSASWQPKDPHTASIALGTYDRGARLVIDPVITYSTWFAGTAEDSSFALREMPDGTVLLAGNTRSVDLPQSEALNSVSVKNLAGAGQCFVARLSPATKEIRFVSVFGGGPGFTRCTSMDLDAEGRILLSGASSGTPLLTTRNAQYPTQLFTPEAFLARITPDGQALDYSTWLRLDCTSTSGPVIRAAPGQGVYLATGCTGAPSFSDAYRPTGPGAAVLRYDLTRKRFDAGTFVGPGSVQGFDVSPLNAKLFVFGSTSSTDFPLRNAAQTAPPRNGGYAGWYASLTPDLRSLEFSSYVGGQDFHTLITDGRAEADGTFHIAGVADANSIPGVSAIRPGLSGSLEQSPFLIHIAPQGNAFTSTFLAGDSYGFEAAGSSVTIVRLNNGQTCIVGLNDSFVFPGSVPYRGFRNPTMGCMNAQERDFASVTALGGPNSIASFPPVTPSMKGGVWAAQTQLPGGFSDIISFDMRASAIQPARPSDDTDDVILRYVDLGTPRPVLLSPQPFRISALQSNFSGSVDLVGINFAAGMQLEAGGKVFPLTVTDSGSASLAYRSRSLNLSSTFVDLPAGEYSGRLVIPVPGSDPPPASDTFRLIVENLKPLLSPFAPTSDPRVFSVLPPVYRDSEVTWNGQAVPFTYDDTTTTGSVQIPPELSPPGMTGELALRNRAPGGGVSRVLVSFKSTGSSLSGPGATSDPFVPAEMFQLDRNRKILYTLSSTGVTQWTLAVRALPDLSLLASRTIARGGAANALDMKLSRTGDLLYLVDGKLRVSRFRTDSLAEDLHFNIPLDGPLPRAYYPLTVLEDAAETVVAVTPAGRMIVYDRDQPRPYNSADFPSQVNVPEPVIAGSAWVYAIQRADVYKEVPCVTRYPVDSAGFGPPEDFCGPGRNWNKYPETKMYGGNLFLESGGLAFGIRRQPDPFGNMRLAGDYDVIRNIGALSEAAAFDFQFRPTAFRIGLVRLDTGEALGHYPAVGAYASPVATVLFVDDDTMLVSDIQPGGGGRVYVVSGWRAKSEIYPTR